MVQILPQPTSLAAQIGQGLGQGVQQYVGQQRLSSAFDQLKNLPQGSGLIEQLGAIAPALLQVPGGSQLLGELAPLLQKQAIAQTYAGDYGSMQAPGAPQGQGPLTQALQTQPQETPQQKYSTSLAYGGTPEQVQTVHPESTYPQISTQPQVQVMTPDQMNMRAREMVSQSRGQISPQEAIKLVQNENQQIIQNAEFQERQRQNRETFQQTQSQEGLARFQASKEGKEPQDDVVFEKLYQDAIHTARDPNAAYTEARDKFREFAVARRAIKGQLDLAGPFTKLGRLATGKYKDADTVLRDIQPQIQQFKKYGLYDEARDLLAGDLGLGPEQVETALFYPSKEQKSLYNSISPNKNYPEYSPANIRPRFAGNESLLKEDQYPKFKKQIAEILNQDPQANLLVLRGILNQDKHYAWQDISKAMGELVADGSFKPTPQQSNEMGLIIQPPLPGLVEQFQYLWKGKK